ncbi:MAG: acyltransferase [Hymenobacter sp.]|nr:MAG: acyltransferase [Hymenobacter sp.]
MQTLTQPPQSVTPEQLKLSRTFDFNLEALRGVAAILVVWHHVIEHQHWLDPHYAPGGIFTFNPSGHLSVLVFFVLSGYVIGRVHLLPLGQQDILPYLKKRFTRIYPIYLVSIVLALLVARTSYPPVTVISNLTMTQNFLAPVIFENNPAWSLNFEILFYMLFIPVSFFRLNIPLLAIFFAIIGIIANTQEYYQSAGYALGFAFWLCGVLIARHAQRPYAPSFALMASMLLLLLSLREFNSLTAWFSRVGRLLDKPATFEAGPVQIADLSNLPYCILLVLVFASRDFIYRKQIILVLLLLPAFSFYKRLHHLEAFQDKGIILPACFYVLALLVYFNREKLENVCKRIIHRLSGTGAWSYGLYVIHFPIIAIFARIEWFSGTAFTFIVRLIAYAFLCFASAYFLEKRFQPWIKRIIN